jgi:(2Fe-2S) ferredoxin
MNILAIFVIIILILVILWTFNNLIFKTNIIYDIMCDAKKQATEGSSNIIKNEDLNENNTSNFMLSVWFYIDNWGNEIGNEKNILFLAKDINAETVDDLKGNLSGLSTKITKTDIASNSYKNLNICLDKFENNLFIDIETYSDRSSVSDETSNFTRYKLSNISVQKWNCLTLCIDTRTMDVYLDGKLVNSFILHGLYKNVYNNNAKKNMYLGNIGQGKGFEGFITRIRYDPYALNPEEVYKIYKDGINQSLARSIFNKYRLKVSFLEYNKSIGELSI